MSASRVAAWMVAVAVICGCSGKTIETAAGCDERLEEAHKRQECRACVAKAGHVYHADKPDGSRCAPR